MTGAAKEGDKIKVAVQAGWKGYKIIVTEQISLSGICNCGGL